MAMVTILDDDCRYAHGRFRATDLQRTGGWGQCDVPEDDGVGVLSGQLATGQSVIVRASVVGGSATAGNDYTSTARDITFSSGSTSQTFSVDIADDTLVEGMEDFTVSLTQW